MSHNKNNNNNNERSGLLHHLSPVTKDNDRRQQERRQFHNDDDHQHYCHQRSSSSILFYSIIIVIIFMSSILLWTEQSQQQQVTGSSTTKLLRLANHNNHHNTLLLTTDNNSNDNDDDTILSDNAFTDTIHSRSNATSAPPNNNNNNNNSGNNNNTNNTPGPGGQPMKRCSWVIDLFLQKNSHKTPYELNETFQVQSQSPNVFYRATASIFWRDFVLGGWHDRLSFDNLGIASTFRDGTPLQPKSTWTWVTGDQHLSNFGAWKNRHGDIVYSVNDFDEAAIYDFQVDILRIATSVCSHAHTNGLTEDQVDQALTAFTDTYVNTLVNYVGGDKEQLYEVTPETSTGVLQEFLYDLSTSYEKYDKQVAKYTTNYHFDHNEHTRLKPIEDRALEEEIRSKFTIDKYGATMEHIGWHVKRWSDFFRVMDIARRYGSGVGSYGVDRFYILLEGRDDWDNKNSKKKKKKKKKHLHHDDDEEDDDDEDDDSDNVDDDDDDDNETDNDDDDDTTNNNNPNNKNQPRSVILDVKYEPSPAVEEVLSEDDMAWYRQMFPNPAARAIQAQRHLTSYTDPFTGWIEMKDGRTFVVRQRSPWKASPDLDRLTNVQDFVDFMEHVARITATSHARGTVGKSPAQFKHVIASVLGRHWRDRQVWGRAVNEVARDYRQQVLLDYECFRDYVKSHFF